MDIPSRPNVILCLWHYHVLSIQVRMSHVSPDFDISRAYCILYTVYAVAGVSFQRCVRVHVFHFGVVWYAPIGPRCIASLAPWLGTGFNTVISACCTSWQWRRSLDVLSRMDGQDGHDGHGLEPNDITCSACVSACGKAWRWQMGLELCTAEAAAAVEDVEAPAVVWACSAGMQSFVHTVQYCSYCPE